MALTNIASKVYGFEANFLCVARATPFMTSHTVETVVTSVMGVYDGFDLFFDVKGPTALGLYTHEALFCASVAAHLIL